MVSKRSDLIDKIEFYLKCPTKKEVSERIFTAVERDILDIVNEFEALKLSAPKENARDLTEEIDFFLERVDREKEISFRLKEKMMVQLDILLKEGSIEAWRDILTWYYFLKRKELIVDSFWEFPVLADMIKIFMEEAKNLEHDEIFILKIHSMQELTEVYFRMVFMVRRMAYGIEAENELLSGTVGKKIFPAFIKVLVESNGIDIHC